MLRASIGIMAIRGDRILVAQATLEDLLLVSVDDKLDEQTDRRRW